MATKSTQQPADGTRAAKDIVVLTQQLDAGGNVAGGGTTATSPTYTAHSVTGISDGRKVVTTAGTRVVLAASTAAKYVTITAETDNTGAVVVGGTTVVAALATRQGTPLNPGDDVTLPVDNLNDVNIDSIVSGDGVTFSYVT